MIKIGSVILESVCEVPWWAIPMLPRSGRFDILKDVNESVYLLETESTKYFQGSGWSTQKYIKLACSTILVYETRNGKTESVTVPAGVWAVKGGGCYVHRRAQD